MSIITQVDASGAPPAGAPAARSIENEKVRTGKGRSGAKAHPAKRRTTQEPRMGSVAVQRAFPLDKPIRAETIWLQALDYDHPSYAHRAPGCVDNFP
jgi:hypothetical protein